MNLKQFRANVQATREWLAAGCSIKDVGQYKDVRFNMSNYIDEGHEFDVGVHEPPVDYQGNTCGTACCIAGYVAIRHRGDANHFNAHTFAKRYLGLTADEADTLFYGEGAGVPMAQITPEQALAVIDHAIETGAIDWTVTINQ